MTKRWLFHDVPQQDQVQALAHTLGVHAAIASVLVQKDITTFDTAKAYFRPSLDDLHDPFLMRDMDQAVTRLDQAITQQERILVYGDYDVDGVTSVAMFYSFLRALQVKADFYIPDRHTEGYGISEKAVAWAAQEGFTLIVSLDCGIRAIDCIQKAQALGIDVIVCDHHEPGATLPAAKAILDPKRQDCPYPAKELSGCGVGFKLLQALTLRKQLSKERLYDSLDLVAISIACDLVPIVGENRILTHHGLKKLNANPRPGLQALIDITELTPPLNIANLVFGLGPRINAAGRIDHAALAVQLLLTTTRAQAVRLAQEINQKNSLRRDFDSTITQEALNMIAAMPQTTKATVLFKDDWHRGVVGIVASRCIEQHYRPTVILTAADGKATGSARSVSGYNVYSAIQACADLLDQYGGHAYAAGLTLPLANVPAFQQRFEEVVANTITDELLIPPQKINLSLSLEEIDFRFYDILKQMAPFGNGNMRTVFATDHVIAQSHRILKEKHLKLHVRQKGSSKTWEAIGFGLAHYASIVQNQQPFRMAYTIDEHHYWGERSLQLIVKDLQAITQ